MADSSPAARHNWARSLAPLPGALLSLVPSIACPACLAAYAGVLSTLGVGFLLNERVLLPLIGAFLAMGIASIAWSTRSHGRVGPLVATVIGTLGVISARVIWNIPTVLYASVAMLVIASFWNLWLKRPKPQPLVQLGYGSSPSGIGPAEGNRQPGT